MIKKSKRPISVAFLFLIALAVIKPTPAFADIGPKRTVEVYVEGVSAEAFYVTLLYDGKSNGPLDYDQAKSNCRFPEVADAFINYPAPEGFYFLGEVDKCTVGEAFQWNYRPPDVFHVLVYVPSEGVFHMSGETRAEAFNASFSYDVVSGEVIDLTAFNAKTIGAFALNSVVRTTCTIIIELLIGVLFGLWQKGMIRAIVATNIFTQILLNVSLLIQAMRRGPRMEYVGLYIVLELLTVIIEAIIYSRCLPKYNVKENNLHPRLYSFTANAVTLLIGLYFPW